MFEHSLFIVTIIIFITDITLIINLESDNDFLLFYFMRLFIMFTYIFHQVGIYYVNNNIRDLSFFNSLFVFITLIGFELGFAFKYDYEYYNTNFMYYFVMSTIIIHLFHSIYLVYHTLQSKLKDNELHNVQIQNDIEQ
jgi:hypothetical protein